MQHFLQIPKPLCASAKLVKYYRRELSQKYPSFYNNLLTYVHNNVFKFTLPSVLHGLCHDPQCQDSSFAKP